MLDKTTEYGRLYNRVYYQQNRGKIRKQQMTLKNKQRIREIIDLKLKIEEHKRLEQDIKRLLRKQVNGYFAFIHFKK